MGISIVHYRVNEANTIDDLSDLNMQMDPSKSVNLYKITEDLGIIFMNAADPYDDTEALPYKLLFGNHVDINTGERIINGFVSTPEVKRICEWIESHKLDSLNGFSKMYDNLGGEAKQQLEDIGADTMEGLYTHYAQPLVEFYFAALKDKNSVVICGE